MNEKDPEEPKTPTDWAKFVRTICSVIGVIISVIRFLERD